MQAGLSGHLKPAIGGHPKPANGKRLTGTLTRAGGRYPPSCGKRLERSEITAGHCAGAAGLVAAQKHTGVRRETAATYLKEAGIALRPPGGWGQAAPAKPANDVATDPTRRKRPIR